MFQFFHFFFRIYNYELFLFSLNLQKELNKITNGMCFSKGKLWRLKSDENKSWKSHVVSSSKVLNNVHSFKAKFAMEQVFDKIYEKTTNRKKTFGSSYFTLYYFISSKWCNCAYVSCISEQSGSRQYNAPSGLFQGANNRSISEIKHNGCRAGEEKER